MRYLPCALLLSLGLWSRCCYAETPQVTLVTERSTFTQISSTEHSGGEATKFVQQVLDKAGISQELLYLPWRRAYNYATTEPGTLIFPLARTTQREANFHWVGQIIPVKYYLFRLRSRPDIAIDTLDDARKYSIGVVNYHVHHEFFLARGFTELQPVNGNAQNLKKALLGRVDLFPMSDLGLVPLCARENIDCSQFEPVFQLEEISGGLYMAFNLATDDATVNASRAIYRQLFEDGTHARIFQRRLEYTAQFYEMWPLKVASDTAGTPD